MADEEGPEAGETRRARLVLGLRSAGVTDPQVLGAIEAIQRDLFVPELFKARAWEDSALPIACGQTISQPLIVGLMTQALQLKPRHRVLEIGTGSGYQTAVLARIARYVYTVERYRTLLGEAEARLKALGVQNVISRFGDGGEGWREQAPFDRVLVEPSLLSEAERSWLDSYHAQVLAQVGPHVPPEVRDWLALACAPLGHARAGARPTSPAATPTPTSTRKSCASPTPIWWATSTTSPLLR